MAGGSGHGRIMASGGVLASMTQNYSLCSFDSLLMYGADDDEIQYAPRVVVPQNGSVDFDFFPINYLTMVCDVYLTDIQVLDPLTLYFTWYNRDDEAVINEWQYTIPAGNYMFYSVFSYLMHGDPPNEWNYSETDRPARYRLILTNSDNALLGWSTKTFYWKMVRKERRARVGVVNNGPGAGSFSLDMNIEDVRHHHENSGSGQIKYFSLGPGESANQDFFFEPKLSGSYGFLPRLKVLRDGVYVTEDEDYAVWWLDGDIVEPE